MINIFKTIVRNFTSRPAINLINLTGLSLSLAVVIILSVYCYSELTTDRFHENAGRVYLFVKSNGAIYSPGVFKATIDQKIPGLEEIVRISGTWEVPVFETEGQAPVTGDLLFADEGFFKLFSYHAIDGDLKTALKEPMTAVISQSLSEKLFGTVMSVGRRIKLNNSELLTVSAVIKEPDGNSCLNFTALTSIATRKIVQPGDDGEYTKWGWNNFQTFLLIGKNIDPAKILGSISEIVPKGMRNYTNYEKASLKRLDKIYFSRFTLYGSDYLLFGNKGKVMIMLLVATLVLVVALVNYINISSSQWSERIRQFGLMKVLGVRKSEVLRSIIIESFLFFLLAYVIGVQIAGMAGPAMNRFTGIRLDPAILSSGGFIFYSFISILFLSVAFCIFPAVRISSSRAIENLKKTASFEKKNFSASSTLVTVQFTIALALIAFTLLVQKQVRFGSDNLGIRTDNIIGIKLSQQLNQKKDVLKNMFIDKPYVNKLSFCQYFPGKQISEWGVEFRKNEEKKQIDFNTFNADPAFFGMLGLKLTEGRFYSEDLSVDKTKIVVNEAFARENKIDDPIGGKISGFNGEEYEIVGIVTDFHFKSFNTPIAPLAIFSGPNHSYCLTSINAGNLRELKKSLDEIISVTAELSPSFPVEIRFFDSAVENMYKSELQFRRTFSVFSACAILISCLGILALSLYTCQRRVKEIGIRKVNGADIFQILLILNRDFLKWVVIAFIISVPCSWFAMDKWLQGFTYKTDISWWIFVLSGIIVFVVAFVTVSFQTLRAATLNPVEALRYE